jgi:hypothetical protein
MTENEWLTCRNPWAMLSQLGEQASDRKLRLFICACCQRQLATVSHPPLFMALMVAQQHIETPVSQSELEAATAAIQETLQESIETINVTGPLAEALSYAFLPELLQSGHAAIAVDLLLGSEIQQIARLDLPDDPLDRCEVLREIFGNPFRPSVLHPAWPTATVISLAQAIYDSGDFTRLPFLADALEDAGCTDDALLRHCREPGQHVKGCWVVDLLLRKS